MFLLPSLLLGLAFAVLLGGRPSRLGEIEFRLPAAVPLALIGQIFIFSPLAGGLSVELRQGINLATYVLLTLFAAANVRIKALWILLLGLLLNTIAIASNGGPMPASVSAAHAARIRIPADSNVSLVAPHLRFLGDVFALPAGVPLSNIFSVGDILIGIGMIAFIVLGSLPQDEERSLDPSRLLAPLRERSFRLLAAGKLVSIAGDWITLAALIGWIYGRTNSTGQTTLLLLSRLAPPILGGGAAAYIVDRVSKKRLLITVEYLRGAAVAFALLGVVSGRPILVFAALAGSGALAALSNAAVPAMIPGLLPTEQLASANAGLGIAKDGAMAAGALGAGLMLRWIDVKAALLADLGTFAMAVFLFSLLVEHAAPVAAQVRETARKSGALRYVLGRRWLLTLVFSFGAATLATGLTNATLPKFLNHILGFGPSGYAFGIGALAIGLVAGQAVVGFSRVGERGGRWIGIGLALMAILIAMFGLTTHGPTALLLLGAIGFVDGTTDVLFETVVQRNADPRHLGAVFGFSYAFITATMMSAVAVAPFANGIFAPRGVLLGGSAFLVLAGAIALLGPKPKADTAALEATAEPSGEVIELAQPVAAVPAVSAERFLGGEVRFARGAAAVCALFGPRLRAPLEANDWRQMLALDEIARSQTPNGPGGSHLERAVAAINALFVGRFDTPLTAADWRQLLEVDRIAQAQSHERAVSRIGEGGRVAVPDEFG